MVCEHMDCHNPPEAPHICPFQEEINDDHTTLCCCCSAHTQDCADDV